VRDSEAPEEMSQKNVGGMGGHNAPEQRVADVIRVEVRILVTERAVTKKRGNCKMLAIHGAAYALHWRERSGSILRVMGSGRGSLRLFRNMSRKKITMRNSKPGLGETDSKTGSKPARTLR
jgi:hypothetical protein